MRGFFLCVVLLALVTGGSQSDLKGRDEIVFDYNLDPAARNVATLRLFALQFPREKRKSDWGAGGVLIVCALDGKPLIRNWALEKWWNTWGKISAGEHTVSVCGSFGCPDTSLREMSGPAIENQRQSTRICVSTGKGASGMACRIKGAWNLTFSAEPNHNYAIGYNSVLDPELPAQELGGLTVHDGNMGHRVLIRTGSSGVLYTRIEPFVYEETTNERVGTATPMESE